MLTFYSVSGAGSLTVLRRTSSKSKVGSTSSSRTSLSTDDSYASVDLGVDKLPPTDTPDASHVCSIRSVDLFLVPSDRRDEKFTLKKY